MRWHRTAWPDPVTQPGRDCAQRIPMARPTATGVRCCHWNGDPDIRSSPSDLGWTFQGNAGRRQAEELFRLAHPDIPFKTTILEGAPWGFEPDTKQACIQNFEDHVAKKCPTHRTGATAAFTISTAFVAAFPGFLPLLAPRTVRVFLLFSCSGCMQQVMSAAQTIYALGDPASATKKCTVIFGGSSVYLPCILDVAPRNPDVLFTVADTCESTQYNNVICMYGKAYEAAYLAGIAAGHAAQCSGSASGIVVSFPNYPSVRRVINAFAHGANSVDPAHQTHVVPIETWYDPQLERWAGELLLDKTGASVLFHYTDSYEVNILAHERNKWSIGFHADILPFVGDTILYSVHWDWAQ
eukprot:gene4116-4447_t